MSTIQEERSAELREWERRSYEISRLMQEETLRDLQNPRWYSASRLPALAIAFSLGCGSTVTLAAIMFWLAK